MLKRLDLVNLSSDNWSNVEVWINQQYVVYVSEIDPKKLEQLPFQMFYDANGHYFPADNTPMLIKTLNIYRDGKMYDVPLQLAD